MNLGGWFPTPGQREKLAENPTVSPFDPLMRAAYSRSGLDDSPTQSVPQNSGQVAVAFFVAACGLFPPDDLGGHRFKHQFLSIRVLDVV